jgi:hypothetical protein
MQLLELVNGRARNLHALLDSKVDTAVGRR